MSDGHWSFTTPGSCVRTVAHEMSRVPRCEPLTAGLVYWTVLDSENLARQLGCRIESLDGCAAFLMPPNRPYVRRVVPC